MRRHRVEEILQATEFTTLHSSHGALADFFSRRAAVTAADIAYGANGLLACDRVSITGALLPEDEARRWLLNTVRAHCFVNGGKAASAGHNAVATAVAARHAMSAKATDAVGSVSSMLSILPHGGNDAEVQKAHLNQIVALHRRI